LNNHTFEFKAQDAPPAVSPDKPALRVRFINTPDGKEVITTAIEGENLMKVGENVCLLANYFYSRSHPYVLAPQLSVCGKRWEIGWGSNYHGHALQAYAEPARAI